MQACFPSPPPSGSLQACILPAGFTKSHFQQELVLQNSKPPDSKTISSSKTSKQATPSTPTPLPPLPVVDPFASVNSNAKHRYKNSLNDTHYMLYHEPQPSEQLFEPYSFGFLTSMARLQGKLKRKKSMIVTFIGGSVTAAYCKEPGIGCWVTPVSEWLLQENPQVLLNVIVIISAACCLDCRPSSASDFVVAFLRTPVSEWLLQGISHIHFRVHGDHVCIHLCPISSFESLSPLL